MGMENHRPMRGDIMSITDEIKEIWRKIEFLKAMRDSPFADSDDKDVCDGLIEQNRKLIENLKVYGRKA